MPELCALTAARESLKPLIYNYGISQYGACTLECRPSNVKFVNLQLWYLNRRACALNQRARTDNFVSLQLM